SDRVFIDGSKGREKSDFCYPGGRAQRFVNTVASYHGLEINEDHPPLSVRLPDELGGCRLQANTQPITDGLTIVLRRPGSLHLIDDYFGDQGKASPVREDQREITEFNSAKKLLRYALRTRKNILFAGSTGAGKSSFLNSVLAELKARSEERRVGRESRNRTGQ